MAKFKYSQKLEIQMPKVEGKADTKKMQMAVNKALTRGAQKGTSYVEKGLKAALDKALMASVWTGFSPKTPYSRKNGQVMGSGPRDIVDTGALKNSLNILTKFSVTKVNLEIQYSAPYAALVHYGGVIKPYGNSRAADVIIPARPWIRAVLEGSHGMDKFDLRTPFDRGISEVWSAQFGT